MNIFYTHNDPRIAAQHLDDKRVIKMTLESAQIICAALILRGYSAPYKLTHSRHPVVIWAAESPSNISWLVRWHTALAQTYKSFSGREHASYTTVGRIFQSLVIENEWPTPHPNCACNKKLGIDYTHIEDTILAYSKYLRHRWSIDKRPPIWSNRKKPHWG